MKITDQLTLSSIQEKFNKMFPFLGIEFWKGTNQGRALSKQQLPDKTMKIGEYRIHSGGEKITIDSSMSVKELNTLFSNIYGLDARVFRKSGRAWLETVLTEDWTLKEQNLQGQALAETDNDVKFNPIS